MDYLMKADQESLSSLSKLFKKVCADNGLHTGLVKSTFIILGFVDEAKKAVLMREVEPAEENEENQS